MSTDHAAALMTADQYRLEAQKMIDQAHHHTEIRLSEYCALCAQVYALLAISAQAAENATDLPF